MRTTADFLVVAFATILVSSTARADPFTAREHSCISDAAQYHHVSPRLLEAIARVESNGNAHAIHRNPNGFSDIGLMQIDTAWVPTLSHYGIRSDALFDPCISLYVAAWLLSRNIAQLGLTWSAVGAYNARTPSKRIEYASKVYRALNQLVSAGPMFQQSANPPHTQSTLARAAQ